MHLRLLPYNNLHYQTQPFNMKTIIILAIMAIGINGFTSKPARQTFNEDNTKGFAVVELFTSEGCSSCPSADEALIELSHEYKQNVFILGFHVDYWDRLGWKDACSDAAYSNRQQEYGRIFGLRSIYTPQVIVNGHTEFVGSDRTRLHQNIEKELTESSDPDMDLQAKSISENKVSVSYKIPDRGNQLIRIALVEKYRETAVKRGENSGKTLRHINLVRDFKSVNSGEGSVTMSLPQSLKPENCLIIAYLQDKTSWNISGAKSISIGSSTN